MPADDPDISLPDTARVAVRPQRPAAQGDRPRGHPRASLWALRVIAVLHSGVLAAQPVLAGIYLSGDIDAIDVHEMNSHVVSLMGWLQIIAALAYAWRGRGKYWPLWFSLAFALIAEGQKALGYVRLSDLHIPLGTTLVTIQLLFTVWTFRAAARQGRVDKRRGDADPPQPTREPA